MPKTVKVIQVFVASPSDVKDERDILETLIQELNQTWMTSHAMTFELLQWQTHTYPSFGPDPQSVINEQIGDDYDVFIGILWAKFGTPTPRAKSGTQEEFERAIRRTGENRGAPEVMIYFKQAAVPFSEIDPEQIRLVTEFRRSVSDRGGLYSVFDDTAGFQSSLRAHLAALARKFSVSPVRLAENARSPSQQPMVKTSGFSITSTY